MSHTLGVRGGEAIGFWRGKKTTNTTNATNISIKNRGEGVVSGNL
jgi:hypothetical protein